tara:strand:- start:14975 stop:15097 length:123 start_codon:yes stop_codon:yes gene_type:complete
MKKFTDEHGCDELFYNHDLTKYHGDQTHGDREVVSCEKIK